MFGGWVVKNIMNLLLSHQYSENTVLSSNTLKTTSSSLRRCEKTVILFLADANLLCKFSWNQSMRYTHQIINFLNMGVINRKPSYLRITFNWQTTVFKLWKPYATFTDSKHQFGKLVSKIEAFLCKFSSVSRKILHFHCCLTKTNIQRSPTNTKHVVLK